MRLLHSGFERSKRLFGSLMGERELAAEHVAL
jgi:hypothetical protein